MSSLVLLIVMWPVLGIWPCFNPCRRTRSRKEGLAADKGQACISDKRARVELGILMELWSSEVISRGVQSVPPCEPVCGARRERSAPSSWAFCVLGRDFLFFF